MGMGKKRYLINCTAKSQNLDFTQVTHSSALGAVNVSP